MLPIEVPRLKCLILSHLDTKCSCSCGVADVAGSYNVYSSSKAGTCTEAPHNILEYKKAGSNGCAELAELVHGWHDKLTIALLGRSTRPSTQSLPGVSILFSAYCLFCQHMHAYATLPYLAQQLSLAICISQLQLWCAESSGFCAIASPWPLQDTVLLCWV